MHTHYTCTPVAVAVTKDIAHRVTMVSCPPPLNNIEPYVSASSGTCPPHTPHTEHGAMCAGRLHTHARQAKVNCLCQTVSFNPLLTCYMFLVFSQLAPHLRTPRAVVALSYHHQLHLIIWCTEARRQFCSG